MSSLLLSELAVRLDKLTAALGATQRELYAVTTLIANELSKQMDGGTTEAVATAPAVQVEAAPTEDAVVREARYTFFTTMVKHLSPEVLPLGRGFVKPVRPGESGMVQYKEDVSRVESELLLKWPSGFYRNQDTKAVQLFIKAKDHWFLIDTSNSATPQTTMQDSVTVFGVAVDSEGVHVERRSIVDLTAQELLTAAKAFDEFFTPNKDAA